MQTTTDHISLYLVAESIIGDMYKDFFNQAMSGYGWNAETRA